VLPELLLLLAPPPLPVIEPVDPAVPPVLPVEVEVVLSAAQPAQVAKSAARARVAMLRKAIDENAGVFRERLVRKDPSS
jgi:hypothetical protein